MGLRTRRAQSRTTTRTIFFYQLQDKFTDQPLTRAEILAVFSDLNIITNDLSRAYMQLEQDDVARAWVDELQNFPLKLKFGVTRRNGLPPTERAGVLTDLNLRPDEGLSELVHCVFYNNSVVGFEFNFYGPRPAKLSAYILEKTQRNTKFVSLINREAAEQLGRYETLSHLNIKVKSSIIDEIRQANETVAGLLENIADYNGIENIELKIGSKTRTSESLDGRILRGLRSFYRNFTNWSDVKKMTVKGIEEQTGRNIEMDLLSEHLMSKQQVIKVGERSRAIQSESAYRAIENAATELQDQIRESIAD